MIGRLYCRLIGRVGFGIGSAARPVQVNRIGERVPEWAADSPVKVVKFRSVAWRAYSGMPRSLVG
jgi:hypothetical protein